MKSPPRDPHKATKQPKKTKKKKKIVCAGGKKRVMASGNKTQNFQI